MLQYASNIAMQCCIMDVRVAWSNMQSLWQNAGQTLPEFKKISHISLGNTFNRRTKSVLFHKLDASYRRSWMLFKN